MEVQKRKLASRKVFSLQSLHKTSETDVSLARVKGCIIKPTDPANKMKRTYTDHRVRRFNDIKGTPEALVRREFDHGVVWFEDRPVENSGLDRISDTDYAERLEHEFATDFDAEQKEILTPQNF